MAIDAELIEVLGLAVTLFSDVAFRNAEDGEKDGAENYSGNGGLVFREKVHHGGDKKHGGGKDEANGDFSLADMKVAGHFPGSVAGLGKTQHQHGDGLHGE